MKKLFTIFLALILAAGLLAQAPPKMNYQVVIRDADNNLVADQTVGLRFSILHGSVDGTAVYSETLSASTNANGLISVEIGGAASFSEIDWANGPYFIKTEADPEGNTNYTISGTSQLMTVPYALYAMSAEAVSESYTETDPVFSSWDRSEGITITENQVSDLQDYILSETDPVFASTFNFAEAQPGDMLQFDGEKWIKLTPDFAEADHIHSDATQIEAGFLSVEDKLKLDGLQNSDGSETRLNGGADITITGQGTIIEPYIIGMANGTEPGEIRYWDGNDWVALPPPDETNLTLTLCDGVPVWGPCPGLASIALTEITNITQLTAVADIYIISDGDNEITESGIVYSRNPDPTTTDNKVSSASGSGAFLVNIPKLRPGQIYYVRAYAINSLGAAYSDQIVFSTITYDYHASITDSDGNEYQTVLIGSQEWMTENLKTTKYRNGEEIPVFTNAEDWTGAISGAYSYHSNDDNLKNAYGLLYNWYTIADERGLCPTGWHIATDADWTELTNYLSANTDLGGSSLAISLKSCRQINSPLGGNCATTEHPRWNDYAQYGTNNFKFSALPGGNRSSDGIYHGLGQYSHWWTSTAVDEDRAYSRAIFGVSDHIGNPTYSKKNGLYIRCVKD